MRHLKQAYVTSDGRLVFCYEVAMKIITMIQMDLDTVAVLSSEDASIILNPAFYRSTIHFGFTFVFSKEGGIIRASRTSFPMTGAAPVYTPTNYGTELFHSSFTFSGSQALLGMAGNVL